MKKTNSGRFTALKVAASAIALTLGAGLASSASAQERSGPEGVWNAPDIVVNNDINPNAGGPTGAWDNAENITGVGQMTIRGNPATTGMNLCTGMRR
mgnify:CR=1 FL=1